MNEHIPEAVKAVIFDYDDTLVGTHRVIWNLHKHIARTYYGIELTDLDIKAYWGRPVHELARHYYRTEDIDTAVNRMLLHLDDFPKEKLPHTEPTLRHLKLASKLIGIVSATTRPILDGDCVHTGIPLDIMDYIQTAEDTKFHKPDARVFNPMLKWAARRGITASEVLYIGDGLQDLKAAGNAGFGFLGVTTGLVTSEEFSKYGARSIAGLLELIK